MIVYVPDRETRSTGDLLAVNNQDDAHPARKLPGVIFRGSLTNGKCEIADHNFCEFNKESGAQSNTKMHNVK